MYLNFTGLDIRIVLQGNDYKAIRSAEDLIREAMENEDDDTKKAHVAWLSLLNITEIKNIKKELTQEGSVIEGVLDGGIILRMRCHSIQELNYILRYEGQLNMNDHFDALAATLGPMVGDTTITINSGITDKSLNTLNKEIKRICLQSE